MFISIHLNDDVDQSVKSDDKFDQENDGVIFGDDIDTVNVAHAIEVEGNDDTIQFQSWNVLKTTMRLGLRRYTDGWLKRSKLKFRLCGLVDQQVTLDPFDEFSLLNRNWNDIRTTYAFEDMYLKMIAYPHSSEKEC